MFTVWKFQDFPVPGCSHLVLVPCGLEKSSASCVEALGCPSQVAVTAAL